MSDERTPATTRFGAFAVVAEPPEEARVRAGAAVLDTVGVAIAGSTEPAARIVRQIVAAESPGDGTVLGTSLRASATGAALANGTAAHAHDFDDMCFVSLAHPSAPLVPAALAAAEQSRASGRALLDAYVVGFEIEGRLGRAMNPRHYQRGWHCTSTLGSVGSAAACARLFGLDAGAAAHAIAIAASSASGLKENFGTMVKPLHAGLAARNGVLAAMLAANGMTASPLAVDGPQGFLHAMDGERESLDDIAADLGSRWEILDTGVTVKLYPSCAGTHPTLDALLDLRRRERFTADDVEQVDIDVDSITPTVLIYDRPGNGLEAKFSLPFCAAAAIVFGQVGIATFEGAAFGDPGVAALMPRIAMHPAPALDGIAAPLTQARLTVRLRDGRTLTASANGARGYAERPASPDELAAKFLGCATLALSEDDAERLLDALKDVGTARDVHELLRGSR
jgi:2-methylcitrate dehydratase PrpD